MRSLNCSELECVSGGDWHVGFDFGVVEGWFEGEEDLQDVAGAVGGAVADAYWYGRDATADFYESLSMMFGTSCSSGGGGR